VAANLAIAAALGTGESVLLIDADRTHPCVERVFRLRRSPGLTEMLTRLADAEDCYQSTEFGKLSVVAAGEVDQQFVCNRESAAVQLDTLSHSFDILIFDLPAVDELSTAFVLPSLLDGVLLVVEPGKTRTQTAQRAKDQLLRVDAHLVGVVCNKADARNN
jgi:capsular exopolysaccharide synthesis family protein